MPQDHDHQGKEQDNVRRREQHTKPPSPVEAVQEGAESAPAISPALLSDTRLAGRGNGPVRNATILQAQQAFGNRAVQRFIQRRESESGEDQKRNAAQSLGEAGGSVAEPVGLVPIGTHSIPAPTTEALQASIDQGRAQSDSGMPLATADRARMEHSLGQDLGDVRIHADAGAQQVTDTAGARAATIGRDIYTAPGEYQPGSGEWQNLLGHEVAHVAQTGGREGRGALIGPAGSSNEQEAEGSATALAQGAPVAIGAASASPQVQRAPRPFPPDATAIRFDPTLDPEPVIEFCRNNSNRRAGNVFDSAPGGMRGQIARVFQSAYFQGSKAWASDEAVWNPGILDPYFGIRVEIELLEDNPQQAGAGAATTINNTQSATSTTGTTQTTTQGVSGTVGAGGTSSAGTKAPGTGGPESSGSGTVSASGTASSSTAVGTSGSIATGGTSAAGTASNQTVFTSSVFARITVYIRAWDSVFEYANEQFHGTVGVGGARYTRPDINTVPAAAAAPAGH